MNQNFERIKIALLSVIAITLIVQTFYISRGESEYQENESGNDIQIAGRGDNSSSAPAAASDAVAAAQPSLDTLGTTTVKFQRTEHNFGKIKQNTENTTVFKFKNTGSSPLIIKSAVGSCGCTVPDYPHQPIAPGASGEITVTYKPGAQEGMMSKSVTVTCNTEPITTMLFISADVQKIK